MQIEFASESRAPVAWTAGELRIGRAEGNDLRLVGDGVAARHVRLSCDPRGLVMDVDRGAGPVYVNARPVRERALLRQGDMLGIGGHRLRLCADALADADPDARGTGATLDAGTATLALRAVAGPLSGQVWALRDTLNFGAQGPAELVCDGAASLVVHGHWACLDAEAMDRAVGVRVNGVATRRAVMADGDQLVVGTHHYVLDVSARALTLPAVEVVHSATSGPTSESGWRLRREMVWLVATAIVLAVVLALALLVRF
ncbi:MAG TPA: FHA domain-containing protein [Rhodanobacteraceae bacterium]